jgi:hypothetical protein
LLNSLELLRHAHTAFLFEVVLRLASVGAVLLDYRRQIIRPVTLLLTGRIVLDGVDLTDDNLFGPFKGKSLQTIFSDYLGEHLEHVLVLRVTSGEIAADRLQQSHLMVNLVFAVGSQILGSVSLRHV